MKINNILKITTSTVALSAISGGVTISIASCGENHEPLWIAHRGAPGGFGTSASENFENVTESFEKAGLQSKFMGLETDVYKTSDNQWVVVHDDNPFVNSDPFSTNYGKRMSELYVDDVTYTDALARNIVPSHNYPAFVNDTYHHMNSFTDYLNVCKKFNKFAIIEIKEPSHDVHSGEDPVKSDFGYLCPENNIDGGGWQSINRTKNHLYDLWSTIKAARMQQQCYIISFQEAYIQWFYNYELQIQTDNALSKELQYLVENHCVQQLCSYDTTDPDSSNVGDNTPYKELVNGTSHKSGQHPDGDGKHYDLSLGDDDTAWIANILPITQEMIRYAHNYRCKFGAWTVNLKSEVNKLTKWGIDFITTDYFKPIHKLIEQPDPFDGTRT